MATRNTASASAPRARATKATASASAPRARATKATASASAPRARKTAVNAEVIRESATETHSADVNEQDLFDKFREAADNLAARMGVGMTARRVIGWVLGCMVAFGVGYLIGSAAMILMLAAGVSTGSFVWWLLTFITIAIGGVVGGKLGGFVMEYVADGHASRHASAAKSWVTGLFSSKARPATA